MGVIIIIIIIIISRSEERNFKVMVPTKSKRHPSGSWGIAMRHKRSRELHRNNRNKDQD